MSVLMNNKQNNTRMNIVSNSFLNKYERNWIIIFFNLKGYNLEVVIYKKDHVSENL